MRPATVITIVLLLALLLIAAVVFVVRLQSAELQPGPNTTAMPSVALSASSALP